MARKFGSAAGDTGRVSNVTEALEPIELGSGRPPPAPRGEGRDRERARMRLMTQMDAIPPSTVLHVSTSAAGAYMCSMATVRLGEALTELVDRLRGDVPRERFVGRVLEQALDGHAVARREAPGDATREVGLEKAPRSPERVPAPARAHEPDPPEKPYELPKIAKRKW
jgi:predicted transcriptional regulator